MKKNSKKQLKAVLPLSIALAVTSANSLSLLSAEALTLQPGLENYNENKNIVREQQAKVTSSNKEIEEGFNWAIDKTNQFVMTGKKGVVNKDENRPSGDGTGEKDYLPSYWAGYYDRTAFYGRDFVHQATGGHIAGLEDENFSMFKIFAQNATESRKWYTLWAFNFDGSPHTIDYKDDNNFVREVPAQFELVEKAYEQYLWSGDERYINDEDLWTFYTKVMTDFVDLHDEQNPNGIAEGKGGIFQGSCTYNERGEHPIESGDAIGSQYQATLAYAGMLEARGESKEAEKWYKKADDLKKYFNEEWSVIDPNNKNDHYARIIDKDGKKKNDFGKENSWFIPMKLITEPGERNDNYLDYISEKLGDGIGTTPEAPKNIEAYTYIPDTYFPYNRNEEAWKWMQYILSVRDEDHERPSQGTNGDYPEISFTVVSQTVEGMMGIEANAPEKSIVTAPRLPQDIDWIKIDDLKMGEHELSVQHDGLEKTTLTNKSSNSLKWEVRFYGEYDYINVNGKDLRAKQKEVNGVTVSFVEATVKNGETVVAKVLTGDVYKELCIAAKEAKLTEDMLKEADFTQNGQWELMASYINAAVQRVDGVRFNGIENEDTKYVYDTLDKVNRSYNSIIGRIQHAINGLKTQFDNGTKEGQQIAIDQLEQIIKEESKDLNYEYVNEKTIKSAEKILEEYKTKFNN